MRHTGEAQSPRRFVCRFSTRGSIRTPPIHPVFRHQKGAARLNGRCHVGTAAWMCQHVKGIGTSDSHTRAQQLGHCRDKPLGGYAIPQ